MESEVVKKFLFIDKSCYRRRQDLIVARNFLLTNGWMECCNLKEADSVIFFTCGFSRTKIVDILNEIGKIRGSMKSDAEFILGGCLPITSSESLDGIFNGKLISPSDFSALDALPNIKIKSEEFLKKFGNDVICMIPNHYAKSKISDIPLKLTSILKRMASGHNATSGKRIGIFLSTGCLRKCSYCAARFATGDLKSKPLDAIIQKFTENLKLGYGEFELHADSIGDYGLDIGTNLGELLDRILDINVRFSIAIYDLHPLSFLKYFEKIILLCKAKKIYYLHVPLQSGNERILKLMNRSCDVNDLREKLLEIKSFKRVFMQTTIIIGFPTETMEEFEDTLNFLTDVKFNDVWVHFYSDMPNTESSKLAGKNRQEYYAGKIE
jgi:tRNA A37 methylthiotransferase MiaB